MKATVDAAKAISGVTVTVHVSGLRQVRFRIWLAQIVLKVAAWIMPCKTVLCDCDNEKTL